MSKWKVPTSIASLYNSCRSPKEKDKLLKDYKDWQESRFSQAHYDYLVKEYEKAIQDYVSSTWYNRFVRRNFIAENKAKLELLKKLRDTFRCEEI